ncbi:MAG: glycosyltransferase family 2 protein [Pseudomonadota bacterium]
MKIRFLDEPFSRFKFRIRRRRAEAEVQARAVTPRKHSLDTPLIVSLTSYPPRFEYLRLTLLGVLNQTIAADRTILWIAHQDMDALPADITALSAQGLEIRACDDMRSYKKILPLLAEAPDATIVTADDDVYYKQDWLENIVAAHATSQAPVVCTRGHHITIAENGLPAPYSAWPKNHSKPTWSGRIFPTGVLGVLYAPGCFVDQVTDWDTAARLCPTADDIWLYWMHRMNGSAAFNYSGKSRIIEWVRDPEESLLTVNRIGGNDRQISAMIDHFGWPDLCQTTQET